MFSIGEKVMYGGTGRLRGGGDHIGEILSLSAGKTVLSSAADVPDRHHPDPGGQRQGPHPPVMNRSEAEAVIDAMPTVPAEICTEKNLSALRNYYQKQITSFDSMDLIRLAKSIRAKKIEAEKRQKRIGSTDEKYLRRAEELLFGELAVALEISMDDVPAFIEQRLGSLAAALE